MNSKRSFLKKLLNLTFKSSALYVTTHIYSNMHGALAAGFKCGGKRRPRTPYRINSRQFCCGVNCKNSKWVCHHESFPLPGKRPCLE